MPRGAGHKRLRAHGGNQFGVGVQSRRLRINPHRGPLQTKGAALHRTALCVPGDDFGLALYRRTHRAADDALLGWSDISRLSDGDQFVGQAMHIFKHLSSAHTRIAWLLEYARHLSVRHNDVSFWQEVRERSQTHRHGFIAIGLASLLSFRVFGVKSPAQLDDWTLDRLPAPVRLWVDLYGREALLADFPGTKLYLLLRDQLAHADGSWHREKRSSLLPVHPPPRIIRASRDDSLGKRLRGNVDQCRFILLRLRFHVTQGLRYLVEALRWKRHMAARQAHIPGFETQTSRPSAVHGKAVKFR